MPKLNGGASPNGTSSPGASTDGSGERNALLEQIRLGKKLKPVDVADSHPPGSGSALEGRDALLEQIRQGKALKPVAERPQRPEVPRNNSNNNNQKVEKELDELAEALKAAILMRQKATQSDDSEDSTCEPFDDGEWDD
ncbi:hypothetical protein BIW11_11851 [Tropilaelaps mercedesae]|uniref:WH2 domain-containing protein n=1 Tax=Tropilaelaps mercedesae TaxID=418985 RepID=A0A1V9X9M0_9ACAR|nr:hypothetical protein BIW11_11851 [Tropilaelaps mercedesae]